MAAAGLTKMDMSLSCKERKSQTCKRVYLCVTYNAVKDHSAVRTVYQGQPESCTN